MEIQFCNTRKTDSSVVFAQIWISSFCSRLEPLSTSYCRMGNALCQNSEGVYSFV